MGFYWTILSLALTICVISMATTTRIGYGGARGTGDRENKMANQILGICAEGKYHCSNCSNAVFVEQKRTTSYFGTRLVNITACAPDCGPIECVPRPNGKEGEKNCICPRQDSTCGYGSECDGCDPSHVITMLGWKVCCKDCAHVHSPVTLSVIDLGYLDYPELRCACNNNPYDIIDDGFGPGDIAH